MFATKLDGKNKHYSKNLKRIENKDLKRFTKENQKKLTFKEKQKTFQPSKNLNQNQPLMDFDEFKDFKQQFY